MVQTLAAAGELQRDLQRELTYDGLRAAEAKGNKVSRRPAVDKVADFLGTIVGTAVTRLPRVREPHQRPHRVSTAVLRLVTAFLPAPQLDDEEQ
ncbi:hypothetical protein [Streptomyces sp. NPDC051994]|uniref:hypothetical protein n=1 Tax=unclassified Streptomyces TaxID=2593676 RepID=UPI003442ADC8